MREVGVKKKYLNLDIPAEMQRQFIKRVVCPFKEWGTAAQHTKYEIVYVLHTGSFDN